MSIVNNTLTHIAGNFWAGANELFEVLEFEFIVGWEKIERLLRSSTYVIPTAQPLRARVVVSGSNLEVLGTLTGNTVATGSMRFKEETLTESTDTLTLSETPADTDHIRITPVDSDVAPLKQVASGPALGEYSISGTTVTLNSSQSQATYKCEYLYTDAVNGEKLVFDPANLPTNFKFFGVIKTEDSFTGTAGVYVIECAKVQRDSEIRPIRGGRSSDGNLEFEVNIVNTSPEDVVISKSDAA